VAYANFTSLSFSVSSYYFLLNLGSGFQAHHPEKGTEEKKTSDAMIIERKRKSRQPIIFFT
jgi:hypothetical protein